MQIAVEARDGVTPPTDPQEGARYLLGAAPVGEWAGQGGGRLAAWQDGAWAFFVPMEGWVAWSRADETLLVFHDGEWQPISSGAGGGEGGTGDIAGPITQVLAASGRFFRQDTAGVSGNGGYDWRGYYQPATWSNGPAEEPTYIDDVWAFGINMAGVGLRADNARQYAAWHMESKFYSNAQQAKPWTENFLHVVDTNGGTRRPIGWVGAHDGSFGNVTLAQSLLLLQGNSHQPKIDFNFETNQALVYDGLSTTYLANNVAPHRQRNAAGDSSYALPFIDDAGNLVLSRPVSTPLTAGSRNAQGPRFTARGFNTDAIYIDAPGALAATFQMSCGVTQSASGAVPVTADGTTTVKAAANAVGEAHIGRTIAGSGVPANSRITDVVDATTFRTNNALPASVMAITMSARTKRTVEFSVDNAGVVTYDYANSFIFRDKSASYAFGLHLFQGNLGIGAGASYPTGAKLVVDGPVRLKSYAVAALPSASAAGAGALVYVTDASGGPTLACSDGSAWRVAAALGAVVG